MSDHKMDETLPAADAKAARKLIGRLTDDLTMPDFDDIRSRFMKHRKDYDRTMREGIAATYDVFQIEFKANRIEQWAKELRSQKKNERCYNGGSVLSLNLRINCGFPGDYASECAQVLRHALHRGLSSQQLKDELSDNWVPTVAIAKARAYLRERGLSAPKPKGQYSGTREPKVDAGSASKQPSTTVAQEDSQETSGSTKAAANSADEPLAEDGTHSNDQPTRSVPLCKPPAGVNHTLGLMERDEAGNYQGFRHLTPMEAIRFALDLLWSAQGFQKRGHSSHVTTIVEAVIRLGRMPAAEIGSSLPPPKMRAAAGQ